MAKLTTALLVSLLTVSQFAMAFAADELVEQTIHRRAVDAIIWGLPLVGEDAAEKRGQV